MSSQTIKGAYYPSWSRNLTPAAIETQYFTHIYYAFLNPEPGSFTLNISQSQANQLRDFTNALHSKSPPVKALFAIGGARAGSSVFSPMASHVESRRAFIHSTIQVARTYGFDGVDLDWEFPEDQTQMNNLGSLLREWRVEIQKDARTRARAPLLLTAAVYFAATINWGTPLNFPASSMRDNLDFINVMTYDYGSWNRTATGAHAALRGPNRSTVNALESWFEAGVPRNKLIMGLPLYGRTWKLQNPQVNHIGAPAVGLGPGIDGVLKYYEVVDFNQRNRVMPKHDDTTESVYSVSGENWISYDDDWSVEKKIKYAKPLGFGGYFFWAVDGDHQWALSSKASSSWLRA